jgi:hypothetical protein
MERPARRLLDPKPPATNGGSRAGQQTIHDLANSTHSTQAIVCFSACSRRTFLQDGVCAFPMFHCLSGRTQTNLQRLIILAAQTDPLRAESPLGSRR